MTKAGSKHSRGTKHGAFHPYSTMCKGGEIFEGFFFKWVKLVSIYFFDYILYKLVKDRDFFHFLLRLTDM